jgi:serine/threonine protein kinase/tetratricopeptide (TPR) repeat protein
MTEQSPAEAIFFAALEKGTGDERIAYVNDACGEDSNLRQRVLRLLAAHPKVGNFMEPSPALAPAESSPVMSGPAETVTQHGPTEGVGSVIAGRYKLLETLGHGGMGAVFMAQQTEPVRRLVALKLIKPGMDSRQILARFEAERQALALMDHPNIARVLDAGATDSGRPFFVMELVKGVPITRFCDERQLSPRERLELFIPVCHAIQHAHQKGVIHRDIKPTNVLVCLYDDRPVPKVIDFGVAKAAGSQLTDASLVTGFGAIVGTPEYMSPEQAQLNQLDIDTRSDVYALGILLYELLTGTTPIDRKRLGQDAVLEILRVIREEEPPRPSARLSSSETLASIAATRGTEPARLTRLVRGELDWIVMKCLEKERSRRYETANALARDLERYLHGDVVEARSPSASYRVRKLVRKHRTALATAATVILLLAFGVAISAWQALRATRAEWQSEKERDRAIRSEREARLLQARAAGEEQKARKSAAEATAMIGFFKELTLEARRGVEVPDKGMRDERMDVELGIGRWHTENEKGAIEEGWFVRDRRLDEALAIVDSEKIRALFAEHPLAEAEIREWIATQAWPIDGWLPATGVMDGTEGWFKFPERLGEPPEMPYRVRYNLDVGLRNIERATELRSIHLGPNDVKTLAAMRQLGQTLLSVDQGKGLKVLSELVARSSAAFGPDHDDSLRYLASLADAYEVAEKSDDAVRLWKDVYSRTRASHGSDDLQTLDRCESLAGALEKAGRIEEALRQWEESLRVRRKLGTVSLRLALQEVARLRELTRDHSGGEAIWREALQLVEADKNARVAIPAEFGLGQMKTGIPSPRWVFESRKVNGILDLDDIQESLGQCLLRTGKPAEAELVLRQCLAIRLKRPYLGDLKKFRTKSLLGAALSAQKKFIDAEPLLLSIYEGMPKRLDDMSQDEKLLLTQTLERLVQLYQATGKNDKADAWRKRMQEAKHVGGS